MAKDELGAHARDELGITELSQARPAQAAWTSAVSFTAGAIWPVLAVLAPKTDPHPAVVAFTLLALAVLGATGAALGGAPTGRGALRTLVLSSTALLSATSSANSSAPRSEPSTTCSCDNRRPRRSWIVAETEYHARATIVRCESSVPTRTPSTRSPPGAVAAWRCGAISEFSDNDGVRVTHGRYEPGGELGTSSDR